MPFIIYIYIYIYINIYLKHIYLFLPINCNIDGLLEEDIINKMNHMSMVANAYVTNHEK